MLCSYFFLFFTSLNGKILLLSTAEKTFWLFNRLYYAAKNVTNDDGETNVLRIKPLYYNVTDF